jgi:translation initiation factor IF-2
MTHRRRSAARSSAARQPAAQAARPAPAGQSQVFPAGGPARPMGQSPQGGPARQFGRSPQGGPARPFGQSPQGGPARPFGQQPQGGPARQFGQPAGQGGRPPMGGAARPGGPPRGGMGRSKGPELAPSLEKERVSNYDPNKKMYHRQHDPERQNSRSRRQMVRETGVRVDDDVFRGGRRKGRKPSAQMMMEPIKIEKAFMTAETITVKDLTERIGKPAGEIIKKLLLLGTMATINQEQDFDTAQLICQEFGVELELKLGKTAEDMLSEADTTDAEPDLVTRPPVVTIMGHVDHGKTSLLDYIRKTRVTAGEAGGITQHIGAYTVETTNNNKITFLDTPGHEAFTRMRARGAQVTDIVVLVVAADDGVMPQTIEAINHAKEAGVPIIVAINKIDKPEANPDRVKTQLSDLGLQPEEWGGQSMFVEISALKKEGIDKLIDVILLEAEILELRANFNTKAEGKVLESRIDPGRGTVATVLVERGTLKVGDPFVAGIWPGRVRALFNDRAARVHFATPAMPIEVMGFDDGIPNAGDPFHAVEDEKLARSISAKRQELKRFEDAKNVRKITLENFSDTISEGEIQELKVIVKADVQGSAEALRSSLEKLSTREVRLSVIQALPGAINEGDVELASASKAIIIGFNVRPVPKAKVLADQEKVDIRKYNIIFKAVEEMQLAMEGMLKPDLKEETIATVEVRDTFRTPKAGTVAGCYVLTGTVKRSASVHVVRDDIEIYTGKISSLRRFKDDVREVAAGFECGLAVDGFDTIQVGDQLEIFEMIEVARKLGEVKKE